MNQVILEGLYTWAGGSIGSSFLLFFTNIGDRIKDCLIAQIADERLDESSNTEASVLAQFCLVVMATFWFAVLAYAVALVPDVMAEAKTARTAMQQKTKYEDAFKH